MIDLVSIPDAASFLVMTNFYRSESAFCSGKQLKKNWGSQEICYVSNFTNPPPGWEKVTHEDDRVALINFLSKAPRLLASAESPHQEETKETKTAMSTETAGKKLPPQKKAAPPKAPAGKATKSATTPVAKKPAATVVETSASETYPWLRNRFKSAIVDSIKDEAVKRTFRAEIKELDAAAAVKAAVKAGHLDEDLGKQVKFFLAFVEEGVTKAK